MKLEKKWVKDLALDFVEETNWKRIYESRSGYVFIFSKVTDEVKVKPKTK